MAPLTKREVIDVTLSEVRVETCAALQTLAKIVTRQLRTIDLSVLVGHDDGRAADALDTIAIEAAAARDRLRGVDPQDRIGVGGKRGTYLRAVRKALGFTVP